MSQRLAVVATAFLAAGMLNQMGYAAVKFPDYPIGTVVRETANAHTLFSTFKTDVLGYLEVDLRQSENILESAATLVPQGTRSSESSWIQILAGFGLIVFTALRRS